MEHSCGDPPHIGITHMSPHRWVSHVRHFLTKGHSCRKGSNGVSSLYVYLFIPFQRWNVRVAKFTRRAVMPVCPPVLSPTGPQNA